ncbi:MAG: sensor histidine kinase [Cyanobacteria bacterium J06649_4]
MDTAVFVSPTIQKILRWVEWFLIVHCLLDSLTSVGFEHSWISYLQLGFFITTTTALSLFLPVSRSLSQRRAYIAAEMLPLILTVTLPINDFLFFELFILKACFLLPRRDVVITVATTVSLFLAQIIWRLPALIERSRINSASYFNQPNQIIFDIVVEYIVGCTFVILMGIVFAAEQRSRHRAEMLTQEVETLATNLERTRIARDIHDSLGHSLTTLDVQLALAERYSQAAFCELALTATESDETSQQTAKQQTAKQQTTREKNQKENQIKLQKSLKAAQQLATQCLTEARQSLHTMREPSFSLTDALNTLADQMRQFFAINLHVEMSQPIPQQLSYQLYLMTKEGLSNAQKHAHCSRVNLAVISENQPDNPENQTITITITDNGCGFDHTNVSSGYGLRGMHERSQLLGGQFTIHSRRTSANSSLASASHPLTSASPRGTTLRITIPLNDSTYD